MENKFLKSRNFRFGTLSVLITVMVIVLVAALNAVVSALFVKYPLNIDLTEDRIFEISPETRDFLEGLNRDVDIYVLNTEAAFTASAPQAYFVQANEVIRKYAQYSSRVRLNYLDLLRNPGFASGYPNVTLQVNDILISSGEQYTSLSSQDLFNIQSSYYGSYVASSRAEQTMTSAILKAAGEETLVVQVITGHGEEQITPFTELLALNSYEVQTLNLLTEDLSPNTAVAILAGPSRDLSAEELRKLDVFLEGQNRTLFYLASARQGVLPNLAAFLAEWGIEVEEGVAFEINQSRVISNSVYIALGDYAEEQFSRNSAAQELLPVIPQSRPLRALFEAERYRTVSVLLRFSSTSGVRPADAPQDWIPTSRDIVGGIPSLMISRSVRNNPSGGALLRSNVLVCGSTLALNQNILGSPNIANSGYFLDTLNILNGRENLIRVEDKTLGFTELGATVDQVMLIAIIFAVLLPLAILISGIVVWIKRRHA